jgi:hypothetical protein
VPLVASVRGEQYAGNSTQRLKTMHPYSTSPYGGLGSPEDDHLSRSVEDATEYFAYYVTAGGDAQHKREFQEKFDPPHSVACKHCMSWGKGGVGSVH